MEIINYGHIVQQGEIAIWTICLFCSRGDSLLLFYNEIKIIKYNTSISVVYTILERLFITWEDSFSIKWMDNKSKRHIVESPLRCAISGCFEKGNICCKSCDIKKCRYKCNFIDKAVCEHQLYSAF